MRILAAPRGITDDGSTAAAARPEPVSGLPSPVTTAAGGMKMARVDALFQFLVEQQGYELLLPSDDYCCLVGPSGSQILNRVLGAGELEELVAEVLPDALRPAWTSGEAASFVRRTDAGEFAVRAARTPQGPQVTLARTPLDHLERLVLRARDAGASDLVLGEGVPAFWRRGGKLERVAEGTALPVGALTSFLAATTNPHQPGRSVLAVGAAGRVRCAILPAEDSLVATLHLLPDAVAPLDGLPPAFHDVLSEREGLILACALPGQGLTRLLGGLLATIAQEADAHVVWIEALAETPAPDGQALVTRYTPAPARMRCDAIRDALAVGARVLFTDALPDAAALLAALDAAQSGCLVIAGCSARSVATAVDVLTHLMPAEQRDEVRRRLARTLIGAVAQVLCPGTSGDLVPAREVLVSTSASEVAIHGGHLDELSAGIHAVGFSLDDALLRLVLEGKVDPAVAAAHAQDRSRFRDAVAARAQRELGRTSKREG